jgi:hypothetical protein
MELFMDTEIQGHDTNNNVFQAGGRIGSTRFFINFIYSQLPIWGSFLMIHLLEKDYVNKTQENFPDTVLYTWIVCMLPFVYYFFQNIFKRVRDYSGQEVSMFKKAQYTVGMCLPCINVILGIIILFSKSADKHLKDEAVVNPEGPCKIDQIERIAELKAKGLLTEEEFKHMKEAIIKKAS